MCVFKVLTGYTDDVGYEYLKGYNLIIIVIKDHVRGSLVKYHSGIQSTSYMNVSECTKTTSEHEARTQAVGQYRT